jgi:hypothetical protein
MKQVAVKFPDSVTTDERALRRNMSRICGKQRLESFSIMFVACFIKFQICRFNLLHE